MATASAADERGSLSRDRIVATAIALADADGVAKLSMRALARELGFEVMSLYNHVANKAALLTAMVDAVAAEVADPAPTEAPLAAIRSMAIDMHDALMRHRWAPGLWGSNMPGPARVAQMETLLRLLDESGLSSGVAHHGFHAVTNHVVGYTLQQLGFTVVEEKGDDLAQEFLSGLSDQDTPHVIAHVHQHLAGDTGSSFELVLDLILDGLVRLDAEG